MIFSQIVKKVVVFNGTQKLITVLTTPHLRSLSQSSLIHSNTPNFITKQLVVHIDRVEGRRNVYKNEARNLRGRKLVRATHRWNVIR